MRDSITLLQLDIYRLKNWFRSHSGTKLLVFIGFLVVISGICLIELFLSYSFFLFNKTHDEFGEAVTSYSLNASLLILFFMSVASSILSNQTGLFKPGFLRLVFSAPIAAKSIFFARYMAMLIPSTILLILLVSPIFLSFGITHSLSFDYLLRCILVLLLLSLASHAIGNSIALASAIANSKISDLFSKLIVLLSFSASLLLMRFLFPPEFFSLYNAQNWLEFQSQLGALPLHTGLIPTNWLANTISQGWSVQTGYATVGTMILVFSGWELGKRWFRKVWIIQNQGRTLASSSSFRRMGKIIYMSPFSSPVGSLVVSEILSVFRSQGEVNYLAYLVGLSTILLFLARNIPGLQTSNPEYLPVVQTLLLVGYSYVAMTLGARYAYPLVAKEKRTSWLLFSVPLKRDSILHAKMVFSLLIVLPVFLVGILAASSAYFTSTIFIAYTVFLALISAYVAVINLLFGTIAPNFSESENPEATSTSGSGMAAIVVSLLAIGLSGIIFYLICTGYFPGVIGLAVVAGTFIFTLIPIWAISIKKLSLYNI